MKNIIVCCHCFLLTIYTLESLKKKKNYTSVSVLNFDLYLSLGMDPGVRCHEMKANPTEYLWSKYECFLISGCQDMNFMYETLYSMCDWNRNTANRGDYKETSVA